MLLSFTWIKSNSINYSWELTIYFSLIILLCFILFVFLPIIYYLQLIANRILFEIDCRSYIICSYSRSYIICSWLVIIYYLQLTADHILFKIDCSVLLLAILFPELLDLLGEDVHLTFSCFHCNYSISHLTAIYKQCWLAIRNNNNIQAIRIGSVYIG